MPALPAVAPRPFDKGEEQKLRKGPAEIDGRIDLHGMTQAEAYDALHRFIRNAVKTGRRTLLVITGKGRVGGGVLRRQLPLWLEDGELRGTVLAFTPAKQKDGGEGAFYIKLRKDKKP
jgi:DNA-nicking Smr family endonuclease